MPNNGSIRKGRVLPVFPVFLTSPSQAAHLLLEGRQLICLVRHGQTDWNQIKRLQGREDVPMNGTGRLQAACTAMIFRRCFSAGVHFGTVCTSPLSRAADTAGYITAALASPDDTDPALLTPAESPLIVLPSLNERDYGSLSGLTLEERKVLFPKVEKQAGNVESVPAAAARMYGAFDDMMDAVPGKAVIGVTHGGIINAVFSRLTSGEIGTGKTLTVNCSVSLIAAGIGSPVPLAYNLQEDGIYEYMIKMLRSGAEL